MVLSERGAKSLNSLGQMIYVTESKQQFLIIAERTTPRINFKLIIRIRGWVRVWKGFI